jgi:diketogulonate reductase-like aldo/keto reductase
VWKRHQKEEDPWTAASRRMEAHWKYMEEARKAGRIKDVGPSTEEIIRTMREEPYE